MNDQNDQDPNRFIKRLERDTPGAQGEAVHNVRTVTSRSESGPRNPTTDPLRALGRTRIGRYEVLYPIGHGGMGFVYAGRLSGMGGFEKLVAIKVIHPHLATDSQSVDMFLDEARLAAQLHHSNVAQIYEVGEDEGVYFMIGELVLGVDLGTFLNRAVEQGRPLSAALSAGICAQVCRGLHAAHELKGPDGQALCLVHRDVSLSNILVSLDGGVKLIDFGVAWAMERLADTLDKGFKGKLEYGSPEQWNQERLDRRTDIFSLGIVLYKAVTGRHPVETLSTPKRILLLLEGRIMPPSQALPAIDPDLERILLTALAHEREARFATAEVMEEALALFIKKTGEETSPSAITRLVRELYPDLADRHQQRLKEIKKDPRSGSERVSPRPSPSRFPLLVGALLSAILLALLFIALWLVARPSLAPPTPPPPPATAPSLPARSSSAPAFPPDLTPDGSPGAPSLAPKSAGAIRKPPGYSPEPPRPSNARRAGETERATPLKLEDNPYE